MKSKLVKLKSALDSKAFSALDYAFAILTLLYGIYTFSSLIIFVGVIALILAYVKPAKMVEILLKKKLIKK